MQFARPTRRLTVVALVMLGWLVAGLTLPLFLVSDDIDGSLAGGSVNAAPRDSHSVSAPIKLSDMPGLTLDRGVLYLVGGGSGAVLSGAEASAVLANGSGRIGIESATIRLNLADNGIASDSIREDRPSAPMVEALANGAFEALKIKRSVLALTTPDGHTEVLTDISAEVLNRRRSASGWQVAGSGLVHGHRVRFEMSVGQQPADRKASARGPVLLKITIKGQDVDAVLDGALATDGGVTIKGPTEIKIADLRQFARLFNPSWPMGAGLREVRIRGDADWSSKGLVVSKSALQMDGNEATGFLTLKLSGPRPSIGGTFALKTLDLTTYLATTASEPATWWAVLTSSSPGLPLIKMFDADVRISADRVKVQGVDLGRSATSIAIKDGRLLADIAECEFYGGKGGGQITVDHSGQQPRLVMRGKFDNVDAEKAVLGLFGQAFVGGRAALVADLSASGPSSGELTHSLSGKVAVSIKEGGRLAADLRSMLAAAQKKEIDGWSAVPRAQMAFDQLDGRFALRHGYVLTEQLDVKLGDATIAASGALGIATGRIELRMPMATALSASGQPDALILSGPLAAPRIRSEAAGQAGQPDAPRPPRG